MAQSKFRPFAGRGFRLGTGQIKRNGSFIDDDDDVEIIETTPDRARKGVKPQTASASGGSARSRMASTFKDEDIENMENLDNIEDIAARPAARKAAFVARQWKHSALSSKPFAFPRPCQMRLSFFVYSSLEYR